MDVLNAVRIRTVWDVRLWRTSTYVPFYSGENWSQHLARDMNTTLNLPQQRKYWLDIKTTKSPGPIMSVCIVNCWPRATQPPD